jgi:hypothetical protein
MNATCRKLHGTVVEFERLDERIAPSPIGVTGGLQAALADASMTHHAHVAAHVRSSHFHTFRMPTDLAVADPAARHMRHVRHHHLAREAFHNAQQLTPGQMVSTAMTAPPVVSVPGSTPPTSAPFTTTPARIAIHPPSPVIIPSDTSSSGGSSGTTASSLPPNVDPNLGTIYQEYVAFQDAGASGTFSPPLAQYIRVQGSSVGVEVHGNGSDYSALVSELQGLGMQIVADDPNYQDIEGFLPILQLPTAATEPQTLSITPMFVPQYH